MTKRRIIDQTGQAHFLTFSTYQRRRFLSPDRAKDIVVDVLAECIRRHSVLCHGFVIMPDHVHAILDMVQEDRLSAFMIAWKKTSSIRIKQFYESQLDNYRSLCPENCPIWQARYYDHNLEESEHLNGKIDYMHNNPIEAGLTVTAVEWKWSSARFYESGQDVGVPISLDY